MRLGNTSRTFDFAVTSEKQMVLLQRHVREDGRYLMVEIFDIEGNALKTLTGKKDTSYELKNSHNKKQKQVTLHAFHPTLVTSFDGKNKQILIGHSENPSFQAFDMNGKSRTIDVRLKRMPVTRADMDEVEEKFEKKRRPTLVFPENKPRYTHLRSLGEGYLVYNQSPYYGLIKGNYLDRQGRMKGQFEMECGVGGRLLGAGKRVLCVLSPSDSDFVLRELLPR